MKHSWNILLISAMATVFFSPLHAAPKPLIRKILAQYAVEHKKQKSFHSRTKKKSQPCAVPLITTTIENKTQHQFTVAYQNPTCHKKNLLVIKTLNPGQETLCTSEATKLLAAITIRLATNPELRDVIYPQKNDERHTIIAADARHIEVSDQEYGTHMTELE